MVWLIRYPAAEEMRPLGVQLPPDDGFTVPEMVGMAQLAEAHGYSTVGVGEIGSTDAFGLLAALASATARIELGTGIITMSTRSVALAAMGFATVASLAPGRVFAGVGAGSPVVVEGWHGRTLPKAVPLAREYVPALRRALAGEALDERGEHVRSRGFTLGLPPADVPIVLAAVNPRMLGLAGALADGVFLTWGAPEVLAERLARVRAGAEEAGRDPAAVRSLAVLYAYCGPDVERARARVRRFLTLYAALPTHNASFAGVVDVERLSARWDAGDRKGAAALITDEAIDRVAAVGTPTHVAERVRAVRAAGVDVPVLMTIGATVRDAEGARATIAAAADAVAATDRSR